ncbi:hypothetical protein EV44_g4095 [Erysiphe necator]|uniref:Uncharacterized protein n=1 Tax=Uncinula necator TaxID=52586 RepID=A0A0B1PA88_UNCNE|nr:hypothetical protein EV44_g4095 [Erysiphe necator]
MASARIRKLDIYHPARLRAMEKTNEARFRLHLRTTTRGRPGAALIHDSRIQRASKLLPESEPPPKLARPGLVSTQPKKIDKGTAASLRKDWLAQLPSSVLCAYSDGSGSS